MSKIDEVVLSGQFRDIDAIRLHVILSLKDVPFRFLKENDGQRFSYQLSHHDKNVVGIYKIAEYINQLSSQPELVPYNRTDYEQMQVWQRWCQKELLSASQKYLQAFDPKERFQAKNVVERCLERLNSSLKENGCLITENMTMADIFIMPIVWKITRSEKDPIPMSYFPDVERWLSQMTEKFNFETFSSFK